MVRVSANINKAVFIGLSNPDHHIKRAKFIYLHFAISGGGGQR